MTCVTSPRQEGADVRLEVGHALVRGGSRAARRGGGPEGEDCAYPYRCRRSESHDGSLASSQRREGGQIGRPGRAISRDCTSSSTASAIVSRDPGDGRLKCAPEIGPPFCGGDW